MPRNEETPARLGPGARRALAAVCALALGVAAAAGLAACGSGKVPDAELIPADQAARMIQDLDDVNQRVSSDDCPGAANALRSLQSQEKRLSASVNQDLRNTLVEGTNHLVDLVNERCGGTTTETTPSITTTTQTQTTTTQTTPTTTTNTTPTTPTTPTGGGGAVSP